MDGDSIRGEDMLLMASGSGHVSLPAGVQVRVTSGSVKYDAVAGQNGDRSVVGSSYGPGYRAPPPTRATSYAGSSASSSLYRSARDDDRASQASRDTYRPSPPRDQATFSRAGSHVGSYVSPSRVPLPKSVAGRSRGGADDWEVMEEKEGWDDDRGSVAPSESISSVGSRGQRSNYGY